MLKQLKVNLQPLCGEWDGQHITNTIVGRYYQFQLHLKWNWDRACRAVGRGSATASPSYEELRFSENPFTPLLRLRRKSDTTLVGEG